MGIERPTNNCLTNLCILSRADNNKIRSKTPSEYRALMPTGTVLADILASAVATEVLFEDDYGAFLEQHAGMLSEVANTLCS